MFYAVVCYTLIFISNYCTKLSFCTHICTGHLLQPSSGSYIIIKTQVAYQCQEMVMTYTSASYNNQLMYSIAKNYSD